MGKTFKAEFFLLLGSIIWWITAAGFTGRVASQKGYDGGLWYMGTFFFAPLALIAAAGLPDRKVRNHEQRSA